MPPKASYSIKDIAKNTKDIFFIVTIIITISGWVYSYSSNKTQIKNNFENTKEHLDKIDKEISIIRDYIGEQRELNGKFKQYIELNISNGKK